MKNDKMNSMEREPLTVFSDVCNGLSSCLISDLLVFIQHELMDIFRLSKTQMSFKLWVLGHIIHTGRSEMKQLLNPLHIAEKTPSER